MPNAQRSTGMPGLDAQHDFLRARRQAITPANLPIKSHERVFFERVPLPDHAREEIVLSDP
jgi:hypothetical protein